jgi:transcriptional regulator with XRE-family HTH domain
MSERLQTATENLETAFLERTDSEVARRLAELERDPQVARQAARLRAAEQRRQQLRVDLRTLRELRELSQVQLAARIGTSQPAVARLEAGFTDPRLSTLERYAAATDADLKISVGADESATADARRVVRTTVEAWNNHDLTAWSSVFHDDVEFIAAGLDRSEVGRRRAERFFSVWHHAFPDTRVNETSLLADGSRACFEGLFEGTQNGELHVEPRPFEATGRRVSMPFVIRQDARNGRCSRFVVYFDQIHLLYQIGVREVRLLEYASALAII